MDIWDWVYASTFGADAQNRARRAYFRDFERAAALAEDDPRGAIALIETTIARAKNAGDGWWEMWLEHWRLQFLLTKARDPKSALPIAARCTLEVRKSLYDAFPQRVCLHEDLISAYAQTDPVGNADLIQSALDYMDKEIAPGAECRMCHAGLRAEFLRMNGKSEAIEAGLDYIALSERENVEFHRAQGLMELCHACWTLTPDEAPAKLEAWSATALESARAANYDEGMAEILMWNALAAQLNDRDDAARKFELAHQARERYGAPPGAGYYVAALAYLEERDDFSEALKWIEAELEEIAATGQVHRETLRRLKKCALLKRTGADASAEIARVRALMGELKNADWVERALESLL